MDQYGFPGDVSYMNQNRFMPYHRGLGTTALRGDSYRGALGKRVRMGSVSARADDAALFNSLGITLAGSGLGSVSDREMCRILTTTGGALIGAIGGAAIGERPTRRAGESDTSFNRRVADWETATRTATAAGTSITAAAELCNLIDEAETTATTENTGMSELEILQARLALEQLYAQQTAAKPAIPQSALVVGGLAVAGLAAFILLR